MTSIASGVGSSSFSPLARLQNELSSEVSAGTINSSDQDALSAALTDIDSSLKSDAASGGQAPSPSDMQSKINDLISNEVSGGKLTSAQADELKQVFANTFQGGPGGAGGPGGPGGAGGCGGADGSSASNGTSNSGGSSSSDSDVTQLLTDFLNSLQSSYGSSSSYGTSGSSLVAQIQSLIVNYQA